MKFKDRFDYIWPANDGQDHVPRNDKPNSVVGELEEAVSHQNGTAPLRLFTAGSNLYNSTAMPSDQSTWLIAVPQDGDSEGLLPELTTKLSQQSRSFPQNSVAELGIPSFKVNATSRST